MDVPAQAGQFVQGVAHRLAHAVFVDPAHVVDFHARRHHQLLFNRIHGSDADLHHALWIQKWGFRSQSSQSFGTKARCNGQGHAMDIAAGGDIGGIVIGMGVQPQDGIIFAPFRTVGGNARQGSNRQGVIAAQQDWHPPVFQYAINAIAHRGAPFDGFRQMAISIDRWRVRIDRPVQVAAIFHIIAHAGQGLQQSRNPQRFRSHGPPAMTGPNVAGGTNQGYLRGGCDRIFCSVFSHIVSSPSMNEGDYDRDGSKYPIYLSVIYGRFCCCIGCYRKEIRHGCGRDGPADCY